jgi:hypothetical protein
MSAIWDQIAHLPSGHGPDDDSHPEQTPGAPRCSLCRNRRVHQLMTVSHDKDSCPFKGIAQKKVRAGVKELLEAWDKSPDDQGFEAALLEKVKTLKS